MSSAPEHAPQTTREHKKPAMLIMMFQALKVLLVAYAGLLLLLYLLQGRLLFITSRDMHRTPADFGWAYEDVTLPVQDETTHGWFIPLAGARGTVLFSHGNAGNIADRLESISLLRGFGLNVLAYDYGGYGHSTGRPCESRCNTDIRAMWHYLTETRGIAPEEILLFGRSLGAAVTLDLAAEVQPAAVIAESTFLSTAAVAGEIYWWMPVGRLIKHRFENEKKIGKLQSPVMIVHSPEDEIIPFSHGETLFRLAPEPKKLLEIQGDHNTGFVMSGDVYQAGWREFLDAYLPRE